MCFAAESRHGVEPARVPGVTTAEALERKHAPTQHAETQQRFECVL
jgi:hypothetical protein